MNKAVALVLAVLAVAAPASARRQRHSRRPAPARTVRRSIPAPAVPTIRPVRNVIVFVANGYSETEWAKARTDLARPLSMDRLPETAIAPAPGDKVDEAEWARILGVGQSTMDASLPTLSEVAARQGKLIAVVSGGPFSEWAVRGTLLSESRGPEEAQQRILQMAPVVLTRSSVLGMDNGVPPLSADTQRVLTSETLPLQAAAPADAMPFDTLVFRGLHLAARNPAGFAMLVVGDPDSVKPAEFDAAVSTAIGYARREGNTLVLVERWTDRNPILLQAAGRAADRFSGTLDAGDVPKVIAGVMGLKTFRRDFSPLFAAHGTAAATRTALQPRSGLSLPW